MYQNAGHTTVGHHLQAHRPIVCRFSSDSRPLAPQTVFSSVAEAWGADVQSEVRVLVRLVSSSAHLSAVWCRRSSPPTRRLRRRRRRRRRHQVVIYSPVPRSGTDAPVPPV